MSLLLASKASEKMLVNSFLTWFTSIGGCVGDAAAAAAGGGVGAVTGADVAGGGGVVTDVKPSF